MQNCTPSVLFLVDRWVPGGVRKHVGDLHQAFRARGVDCAVAGWLPPGDSLPVDVEFHRLPLYSGGGNKSIPGLYESVRQLTTILKSGRFNILHLHSRFVTLLAAISGKGLPIRTVYTSHNTFHDLRFLPWYPRQVICLTTAGERAFRKNHFLPNDLEVAVIPNGIEINTIAPEMIPESKPYSFLYLGRLEKQKGVDLLLRAIAELRDTEVHVAIAGTGSEEQRLLALSQRLGLNRMVTFAGYADNPRPLVQQSSALILPSIELEGFGYVILEAFAFRRPVIVSDLSVFDETIRDGVTGIRFKAGDPLALAAALRQAMSDPDLLRRMGENGFSLLCEQFTLQKMIDATLEFYCSDPGTGLPILW